MAGVQPGRARAGRGPSSEGGVEGGLPEGGSPRSQCSLGKAGLPGKGRKVSQLRGQVGEEGVRGGGRGRGQWVSAARSTSACRSRSAATESRPGLAGTGVLLPWGSEATGEEDRQLEF